MNTKLIMVLTSLASGSLLAGNVYYVDPRGDDTWSGTVPYEQRDEDSKIGPRQTLTKATELTTANNGDVIFAAEGVYNSKNKNNYRVWLTNGTKLIASGKKENTVIEGAPDSGVELDVSPYGCGPNAIHGVYLPANAQIVGFTVRNCYGQGTDKWGAGTAGADSSALIVDCVISNCVSGRAAGQNGGTSIRCEFSRNRGITSGSHLQNGVSYNSYFHDALSTSDYIYHVYKSTIYNCRVECQANDCTAYNSFIRTDRASSKLYYSIVATKAGNTVLGTGSYNISADYAKVDENQRPIAGSWCLNAGDYVSYTNGASAAVMEHLDTDFKGGQRLYGGVIDIGCGEADPRAEWASAISGATVGFSVEKVSGEVAAPANGVLTLPVGATFRTGWVAQADYETEYRCSFVATASDGATLKVFLDDATEPFATVTAADGAKTVAYANGGSHQLRYVVEGEGGVTVSTFAFAWSKRYYVDPRGDDTWSGTVPYEQRDEGNKIGPRQTLTKATELTTANNGDVIFAAEGVYKSKNKNNYRVWLTNGTKLIASGKKENTVIEGAPDSGVELDVSPFGCGPNAIYGVYLPANAQLVGFTVRNCYSRGYGSGDYGAGVVAADVTGLIVDCVVSNCFAGRAAGMSNGTAIRCRFVDNNAGYTGKHILKTVCYDCHFGTSRGGDFSVYQAMLYNCIQAAGDAAESTYYNCFFTGESRRADKFYHSAVNGTLSGTCSLETGSFKATGSEMAFDADFRPIQGSNRGIDKGNVFYYTNGVSAAVMEYLGRDFAGGQRIYNGQIDIGCGEYDWRGDFGRRLAKKGVEVVAAPEGVTTNLVAGLDVPAGKPLKMKFVLRTSGEASFKVTADAGASAAVMVDGSALAIGDDGWCRFFGEEGEYDVEVAVTGSGEATVSDVTLPKFGTVLILR